MCLHVLLKKFRTVEGPKTDWTEIDCTIVRYDFLALHARRIWLHYIWRIVWVLDLSIFYLNRKVRLKRLRAQSVIERFHRRILYMEKY